MLEARLPEASLLKKVTDAMRDLVNEGSILCTPQGMSLQAMDSSHVSLCSWQLNESAFEGYRCDVDTALGLSLVNLGKVLKCVNNDDTLTLRRDDNSDVLTIVCESTKSERISDFEVKLMDIDDEQLGIPEQNEDCRITMPSRELERIMKDLMALGDVCTIDCTKDGVSFSVSGEVGTANVTLKSTSENDSNPNEGGTACNIQAKSAVKLTVALRYLMNFTKATPLADTVTLKLTDNAPLAVRYSLKDSGHVEYFLAPKLDEETED